MLCKKLRSGRPNKGIVSDLSLNKIDRQESTLVPVGSNFAMLVMNMCHLSNFVRHSYA